MAQSEISYENKIEDGGVTAEGIVGSADLNDIKNTVNANASDVTARVGDLEAGAADSIVYVKTASDLSGTLDSSKTYFIDGVVDLTGSGISLEIPVGGLNIIGSTFDISKLICSDSGYSLFTSPVGGSGNLLLRDLAMEITGTSSEVFDIVGGTGNEAFELARVNWNNCTSLGTIDTYRQGFESGTGRFGGTPNLILKGSWSGGYFIDSSIVRSLDSGMTGALYEAGAGFVMESRFRSNQNIDLPSLAAFFDFSQVNFTNPSTLQMDGCIVTRDGISLYSDANITPNIAAGDLECSWSGNVGMGNTFVGGETTCTVEAATVVSVAGTFYDLNGTFAATELQHFDSPASGQLRHLGTTPINYTITGNFVLEAGANEEVDLKVVIYRSATASFEDGSTLRRVVNNLQGGRNVGYFAASDNIILNQNDYVKLQVANVNDTTNVTAELDSFFNVNKR